MEYYARARDSRGGRPTSHQNLARIYAPQLKKKNRPTQKANAKGKILINISYCNNGSRDVVRKLIKKYGWCETTDDVCHIMWTDQRFALSYEPFRMCNSRRVLRTNNLPDAREVASKSFTLSALQDMKKLFPHHYDFFPDSWDLGQAGMCNCRSNM